MRGLERHGYLCPAGKELRQRQKLYRVPRSFVDENGMTRWLRRLGRIAWVAAICGTVAWLGLVTISPGEPDAAHPVRYAHRHSVSYVSEEMNLVLQILLGVNFALVVVAAGCHFASKDVGDSDWPGRIGEP